jgi:hypothetical protein
MNPFEHEADSVASGDGQRMPSRGRSIQMRPVHAHASSSHALSVDYTHNGPPLFLQAGEDEDKDCLPSRLHAARSVDKRSESGTHQSSQFDLGPAPPYQASPQPRPATATKPETKAKGKGALRHITVWASECFWLLLTVAAFVAMVVVLWRYDNEQLPNWPLGLTLNTAVAFLATLCRSTAVITVTEALSQLKWNWFVTGQRPVRDLHVIDQATRYPWASLEMLTRMRGRVWPLGFMASAVLVTGVVTSFVTQSAIGYSTRLIGTAQDNVTTSYSRSYPPAKVMNGEYVGE